MEEEDGGVRRREIRGKGRTKRKGKTKTGKQAKAEPEPEGPAVTARGFRSSVVKKEPGSATKAKTGKLQA